MARFVVTVKTPPAPTIFDRVSEFWIRYINLACDDAVTTSETDQYSSFV